MKLPDSVLITVTSENQPLSGMWVVLEFPMSQKNPYQLAFGPSSSDGQIRLTAEQIQKEALKVNQLFLMDYAAIDTFWTGTLRVTPMNRPALQRALSAARTFRSYEYPPGYEDSLVAADNALGKTPKATLMVSVECEPNKACKIEVRSATAQ